MGKIDNHNKEPCGLLHRAWMRNLSITKPTMVTYSASQGPFFWHGIILIPAWISNHMPSNVWMKLLIHSQTSTVVTLQPTRPLGRVYFKFKWQSENQCQRTYSKWIVVFIPHFQSKHSHLIVPKRLLMSNCPRQSPWLLIVLVHSLRAARLDIAWLVESVT